MNEKKKKMVPKIRDKNKHHKMNLDFFAFPSLFFPVVDNFWHFVCMCMFVCVGIRCFWIYTLNRPPFADEFQINTTLTGQVFSFDYMLIFL